MTSLANVEGEESFEVSYLGEAAEVSQERISDDELILIKGTKVWTIDQSEHSIYFKSTNHRPEQPAP